MTYPLLCPGCLTQFHTIGALMNHGRYGKFCTPEMRFWGRVKKTDGCWLWQGAVNTTGYGMVSWSGKKNIVAHRLAYELLRGPITAGLFALHKCDTPRCVNPDHIFLGTDADNKADCVAKDRHSRGSRNGQAKITEAQVAELRRLRGEGWKFKNLAARFGISPTTAINIYNRKLWKHVL